MQADILHTRPDDAQATRLCGKHVDLIGSLPDITEETFNGIGGLNVSVHALRKGIKRQEVLFVLGQASHRFWVAQRVLGFESSQLDQRLLLCRLLPDAHQFGLDRSSLSPRDGIEDIVYGLQTSSRGTPCHIVPGQTSIHSIDELVKSSSLREKLFCAHRAETRGMQSGPRTGLLLIAGPTPRV